MLVRMETQTVSPIGGSAKRGRENLVSRKSALMKESLLGFLLSVLIASEVHAEQVCLPACLPAKPLDKYRPRPGVDPPLAKLRRYRTRASRFKKK